MKPIFRNLKDDNRNKAITHKIYVKTQCGKKLRTVTSTTIHYMSRESTK